MSLTIQQLAQLCDADIVGDPGDSPLHAAADIMSAKTGELTVLSDSKYKKYLPECRASACLIARDFDRRDAPTDLCFLICDDPEISFLKAVNALHPVTVIDKQISPQCAIANDADIAANVYIGPFATIGRQTRIGADSAIHAGAHIGNHVSIGNNCTIYPNVVIYDHTVIGDHVTIHAGAVVAADGFGYKYRDNQHVKVPHVGNVVIEDHVEIGANTCIDRGALGSTTIGAGSKIDNLVQLGHNNQVGKNVIICGQSGISGSCTIEDGAILAGSSGIADHVTIGRQAVVMARSGVSQDISPGTQVWGSPAKERKQAWKELAALSKLPELLKAFKQLQNRIENLEKK